MTGRRLFLALLLLGPLGCSLPPRPEPGDPALPLFVQVLEAPDAERARALERLEAEHPGSPWTLRARTAAELRTSRENLRRRIRELERENVRQGQECKALRSEADRLREDLKKLKLIIIDTERRAVP